MTDNDQLTATTLRLALDREVAKHQLSSGAWPRLDRSGLRRQPRRRAAIVGVCTAIVATAAAMAPYLWDGLSGPLASHPPPQPGPHLVIGARTNVSSTGPLTTGYGGVWIIGPGVIYRVDPATARTVATIPTPGTSGKGSQIVTGAGAVWATSNGGHVGVYRIDPRHNRVMSFIRLQPNPIGIAVAHGRIWVTEPKDGPGIVVRIDPRTNRVSGPPIRVGLGPGAIVSGAGTLWVSGMDLRAVSTRRQAQYPARTAVRGVALTPPGTPESAGSTPPGQVHSGQPVSTWFSASIQ